MARVHAFILLSEEPVDLDTVAAELSISRGNASMSLRELRNWGIIKRVHVPGERRDFYVAEPEVWSMIFKIAGERKKREFDPALHALRRLLSETNGKGRAEVNERLSELEKTLTTMDAILEKFLRSEKISRAMLDLLGGTKG